MINLHKIFNSCSRININSKYFSKIWQLITYFLLRVSKNEAVVFLERRQISTTFNNFFGTTVGRGFAINNSQPHNTL